MATTEGLKENQPIAPARKTTYFRDAQAAIKIRDGKFLHFEPLDIPGTPLSELIIRERRGE